MSDPKCYEEAIVDIHANKWKLAMEEEINPMYKNNVWQLVNILDLVKLVNCIWVFTKKRNFEGKIERFKARLVVKDFTQQYAIDFDETFFLVGRIQSIRTILALVAYYDYKLFSNEYKYSIFK